MKYLLFFIIWLTKYILHSIINFVRHRGVEQLAARRAHNPEVEGSSPSPATTKIGVFIEFNGSIKTPFYL